MDWRRGRYAAVLALVGAIVVFALGAAPASAATPPTASFTVTTPTSPADQSPSTPAPPTTPDRRPRSAAPSATPGPSTATAPPYPPPQASPRPSPAATRSRSPSLTAKATPPNPPPKRSTNSPTRPSASRRRRPTTPGGPSPSPPTAPPTPTAAPSATRWTVDSNSTPVSTASSFSQAFASGPHSITLTVTDSEGDPPQSSTQNITVDTLPSASFTVTPSPDYASGQTLSFAANQTVDPNGGTLSYAWTVDSNSTPVSTASSFSQTFTGSHTVTLTVTDSEGDPAQSTTQTIDQLPDASFGVTPSAPYHPGQNLTFTANSTTDPNGGTLSYAWTVDSNSTPVSTASSFSQAFPSGPHSITLTVTDSEGDPPQSSTQNITVDTLPSASLSRSRQRRGST